jgi:hypothetical protein
MMPLPLSTLGVLVSGGDSLVKSPLVLLWRSNRVGERVCERLSSYEARTELGKLTRLFSVPLKSNWKLMGVDEECLACLCSVSVSSG